MIEIIKKNGTIDNWEKAQYTDYMYDGKCFIIMHGGKWVGIYNMDCVQSIAVGD